MGAAFHMGMLAKNVYGNDYETNQAARQPSKNGTLTAIFRFNV